MILTSRNTNFLVIAGVCAFLFLLVLIMDGNMNTSGDSVRKLFVTGHNERNLGTCGLKPLEDINEFFNYIEQVNYICQSSLDLGGKTHPGNVKDGNKYVCLDKDIGPEAGNCHVLSFGINNDWSFDDAMDNYNCKIYAFDPTMGATNHYRSANIQFFNLGIYSEKATLPINGKDCKVDSYANIMKSLQLDDTIIDYLKMDVERSEIPFFQSLFKTPELVENIRQIALEIHPGKFKGEATTIGDIYKTYWKIFSTLECYGFRVMFSTPNMVGGNVYKWDYKVRSKCYEIAWAKID